MRGPKARISTLLVKGPRQKKAAKIGEDAMTLKLQRKALQECKVRLAQIKRDEKLALQLARVAKTPRIARIAQTPRMERIAETPKMKQIDTRNCVYMGSKESETCAICTDDFKIGDKIRVLPCFHKFHSDEIDKWFQKSPTCPLCKFQVKLWK